MKKKEPEAPSPQETVARSIFTQDEQGWSMTIGGRKFELGDKPETWIARLTAAAEPAFLEAAVASLGHGWHPLLGTVTLPLPDQKGFRSVPAERLVVRTVQLAYQREVELPKYEEKLEMVVTWWTSLKKRADDGKLTIDDPEVAALKSNVAAVERTAPNGEKPARKVSGGLEERRYRPLLNHEGSPFEETKKGLAWKKSFKEVAGQQALIRDWLLENKQGTAPQVAADLVKNGFKPNQDPVRAVYFYLNEWLKKGWLEEAK